MQRAMLLTNKNSIIEAMRAGRKVHRVTVHSGARPGGRIDEIIGECGRLKIPVGREDLSASGKGREGSRPVVVASCADFQYSDIGDVLDGAKGGDGLKAALALDHVQDPRNLGAVIRACAAGGVTGVVLEKRRCCKVTDAASDTSSGGIEHVKVARVANLANAIEKAKKEGFWIVGAGEEGKVEMWDFDFAFPVLLVMGGEEKGLARLVREKCDDVVRIPTSGSFSTLNVSAAAAVLIFEIRRKWLLKKKV
ncbi:MAG: 23S rRNA (guanosine(2251)-2'-O)-methyltransferase RlmB [bacterium]